MLATTACHAVAEADQVLDRNPAPSWITAFSSGSAKEPPTPEGSGCPAKKFNVVPEMVEM